ncbi:MAG TPA: glycoside hydrolase family 9 protein, partial [Microlunatus sp.]|nr:glycoside hydrolase family 9 protein [Microlunatus sp.]
TLDLAAVGARCARGYRPFDAGFADRCSAAAARAWSAALEHPERYAPEGGVGGGPYDDTDVTDEFSWAAAELFAATGDRSYLDRVATRLTVDNFSWRDTGGLAELALVRVRSRLAPELAELVIDQVLEVADRHLADQRAQGYPTPYLPADGHYVWGSNSAVANQALVLAYAYRLSGWAEYRDGALEALDYLLGRNALNQSYVTGYGERSSHHQHHRFWARQLDPSLPQPPPGSLAGGPHDGLADPVARRALQGRAPAKSYVDDIGSYSTNEVAINWNSALAWIAGFAATVD